MTLGAAPREWGHFDLVLGLGANLLPCVPAGPDVRVLPGSALEGKVGKIPSVFNTEGLATGLKQWPTREILPEELAVWSRDSRYNVCVRTGKSSGVYAFDVDVDDPVLADQIHDLFVSAFIDQPQAIRMRSNSSKFLVPFRTEGAWKKRIINTTHGRIELLGTGQQFVACGTHSSGVRYDWLGGLPSHLPLLTASEMDGVWAALSQKFSTSPTTDAGPQSKDPISTDDDPVRAEMTDAEWNDLISALRHILRGDTAATNDGWSEIGYALLSIQHTRPARQLWLDFSRQADGYEPDKPEQWWSAHADQVPRSDYRHIFTIARAEGWGRTVPAEAFAPLLGDAQVVQAEPLDSDTPEIVLPPEPERTTIRVMGGNLPYCIEECTRLLKDELYVHARALVDAEPDATSPTPWRVLSTGELANRLTQRAIWQKYDARLNEWKDIDCPDKLVEKFGGYGTWPSLRPLEAVVTAPFIREDGSICDAEGYDADSRAIYRPNAEFPKVPEASTISDARVALAALLAPFDEFPFVTSNGRSAFVGHILTESARLALDRVPMFWYTSANPGTGKSLLSDIPSLIVHGHAAARRPWPRSEDELRKTLLSSMLAGDRSMTFDNVPNGNKVRTAELCAAITSEWWQDRKLGVSETPRVRNRLVISASGNNVTPTADMARRSLVIRLVPPGDIKGKRYKIPDLRSYVAEHRVNLLMAALTILRAHLIASHKTTYPTPLATFERWSRMVRNALLWLGMADPVETQSGETDEESDGLAPVLAILAPLFADKPILSTDITRAAGHSDALNDALIAAGCDEPFSPRKVGYWLRENRDRIGGEWKLMQGAKSANGRHWIIVSALSNEDLA